jgi:cell wall-associated NlpC family hydrolase
MRLTLFAACLLLALSAHAAPAPHQKNRGHHAAKSQQKTQQKNQSHHSAKSQRQNRSHHIAKPQQASQEAKAQLPPAGQSVDERNADLVMTTFGFLGVPYRRGGNTLETGFDCSGFVRAMYNQTAGYLLPRRAEEQAAATQKIDRSELKPGDLVFFHTMRRAFSHVGIYVGEGKFIHSPRSGAKVRVEDMSLSYWKSRFNGARRVLTGRDEGAHQVAGN